MSDEETTPTTPPVTTDPPMIEETTPEEDPTEPSSPPPPEKGNGWILIQFNQENEYHVFSTNVKDTVLFMGMIELTKAAYMENNFKKQREVFTIPKSRLVIPR